MSSQGKLEQLMGSCFVLQRRESWGSIKEIVGGCYGRSRRSVWDLKGRDWWVAVERRIEVWEDLGRFGWLCWRFRFCEEFVRGGQLIICGVTEVPYKHIQKIYHYSTISGDGSYLTSFTSWTLLPHDSEAEDLPALLTCLDCIFPLLHMFRS